jgi:hypothetical protein
VIAALATSIVGLVVLLAYVRRASRRGAEQPATLSDTSGRVRTAIVKAIFSVRRQFTIIGRFADEHPERVPAIVACEIAYQTLAVAEVYFTLLLISPITPTVATSLVLETVSRLITMLFKVLPMRVGVDEAGSSLFAGHLDLGATTGLTLALVRKLRMLFWSAVGLVFLLPRRSEAATVPALSWSVIGPRVP